MDTDFPSMFEELRGQFNRRIPGGLSTDATDYLSDLLETKMDAPGHGDRKDILRQTYDSMVSWIKGGEPTMLQQKDILQPHEDTVKYREVEYNIIVNSKDRNWCLNTNQNRYNFTTQFNTNFRPQGNGYQAIVNSRLRNITRIEFIKAILPVEGLTVPIALDASSNPQAGFDSVLSLPSVTVLVDEFTGNNYGTNNDIDKSLAVCQYDATWRSECGWNKQVNRGYTLFFPKFMKAQRVYSPTPLANLQALSFQLNDPQGNLLSKIPDSSVLKGIYLGSQITGSIYSGSDSYLFLNMTAYFPLWSYSQMDKVLVQGITDNAGFSEWIESSAGHTVVGIGYGDSSGFTDGPNPVGYANWVIIPNKLDNEVTGAPYVFSSDDAVLMTGITAALATEPAGILNLSRQVQLYMRIITREYDLVSNVRADNV